MRVCLMFPIGLVMLAVSGCSSESNDDARAASYRALDEASAHRCLSYWRWLPFTSKYVVANRCELFAAACKLGDKEACNQLEPEADRTARVQVEQEKLTALVERQCKAGEQKACDLREAAKPTLSPGAVPTRPSDSGPVSDHPSQALPHTDGAIEKKTVGGFRP